MNKCLLMWCSLSLAFCWVNQVYSDDNTNNLSNRPEVMPAMPVNISAEELDANARYEAHKKRVKKQDPYVGDDVLMSMKQIIIPKITFEQTRFLDVVDFLVKAALTNDPQKKGVTVEFSKSVGMNYACTNTLVTLSAYHISFYNALKIITSITGFKMIVKNNKPEIRFFDEPESELLNKSYPVDYSFIERIRSYVESGPTNDYPYVESGPTNDYPRDLQDDLKLMGVQWPRGSSVNYNAGIGQFIVKNTEANLHRIENILRGLNAMPLQVHVTAQFFQFDSTNSSYNAVSGADPDVILGLCTNGFGRLLAAPTVIKQSGERATIKSVTEITFPAEYSELVRSNQNGEASGVTIEVVPAKFCSHEIGVSMDVVPVVLPSNDAVELSVSASYAGMPTWKDYGYELTTSPGQSVYAPMEQPFFHQYSYQAKLTMNDGQSVLASGGIPSQDGKGLIYCVVSVRIVGMDGKPPIGDTKPFYSGSIYGGGSDENGQEWMSRFYSITPTGRHIDFVSTNRPGAPPITSENVSDLKQSFTQMGVTWPSGSSLIYNSMCEKWIMVNTVTNHHVFEKLLNIFQDPPQQVQITARFIVCNSTNIPRGGLGGIDADEVLGLCSNGLGRLLAAPTIIMKNGETSFIKGVTQIIYPNQYAGNADCNTNESGQVDLKGIRTMSFATRDVGVMMEVVPEIDSSRKSMNLAYKLSLSEEPTWKDFGREIPRGDGESSYAPLEQPIFHANRFESESEIFDGGSVVVFGGVPSRDGNELIYCVITARLVGNNGQPSGKDGR